MKTKFQRGFTMIELIVVIVILGILASVALPRFTNMQRDARIAKLNAARGAVSAAAAMVHGSALIRAGQGNQACPGFGNAAITAAGAGNVCTESGLIPVTNFYPTAGVAGGIISAAGLVPGRTAISVASLAAEGYATVAAGAGVSVQIVNAPNPAACFFTYTPSAAQGVAPALTQITAAATAGC